MEVQMPLPREYALRGGGVWLNLYVNGHPHIIWSDGCVEVWAEQDWPHRTLRPGERLKFPGSQTIHALPRSSEATRLFAQAVEW